MKKGKIIPLILFSAFLLAGCGSKNRTESSGTISEETPVTTTVETTTSAHMHSFGECISINETSHERFCECGEKETAEHLWDDGTETRKTTCTEDGEMKYTCLDCGAEKNVTTEKTGHIMAYAYDSGNHWLACTNDGCDYTEGEKEVHTFVANEDCTLQTCSCGYSRTMYRLDITHDDTFIIGESVDFTYTATWNGASKIEIAMLRYCIGGTYYNSGKLYYGSKLTNDDVKPILSNDSNKVTVHLYLRPLDDSELFGPDYHEKDNQDDFFSRVKVFYNGIEMTGDGSMGLSGNCPHYEITNWGENTAPVVKESE